MVMVYLLLYVVSIFVLTQIAGLVSNKIGLKRLVIVGTLPQILFPWLLTHSHVLPFGVLAVLALLQGAAIALYWLPLHIFFASATTRRDTYDQVAAFVAVPQAVGLLAPLLASLIIVWQGFGFLFYIAVGMYFLAMLPLLLIPNYTTHLDYSFRELLAYLKRYRRYFIAEVIMNTGKELDSIIWPLSVFLLLHNIIALGFVGTLLGLGSVLFTFAIGRRLRRTGVARMLQIGAIAMIILWALRYLPLSQPEVLVITTLAGIAALLISVPFTAVMYGLAREDNTREFMLFREFPVICARVLVYSVAAIVASGTLTNIFWLAIIAYALFLLAPLFRLSRNK